MDKKGDRFITGIVSIRDRDVECVQEKFMMSVSALVFDRITWEFSHGVLPQISSLLTTVRSFSHIAERAAFLALCLQPGQKKPASFWLPAHTH